MGSERPDLLRVQTAEPSSAPPTAVSGLLRPPQGPAPHTAQPRVIRCEPLDLPSLCGKVSVPAPHTLFLHSFSRNRSPLSASPTCLAHFAPLNFTSMACFPSAHKHSAPPLPPQPPPIPPSDPPSSLSLDTRSWTLSHAPTLPRSPACHSACSPISWC